MVEDRWLWVDEIAVYWGVKRDTIYKWIDRKGLPIGTGGFGVEAPMRARRRMDEMAA